VLQGGPLFRIDSQSKRDSSHISRLRCAKLDVNS
jgi:hypothetical protein